MSLAGRPSSNGSGGEEGVPPDLEWDADNPPVIFSCSQHTEHMPNCPGDCGEHVCTEGTVLMANEARAWSRAGMSWSGVPTAYAGKVPIGGINVELVDLETKIHVLVELLKDVTNLSQEELDDMWLAHKAGYLRRIREDNEEMVRRTRAASALGIKNKRLLGPDGQPL